VVLQLVLEQSLEVGRGPLFVVLGQTARLPGLFPRLHDEGGAAGGVLVGVGSPEACRGFLEVEGEGGEATGGAEPDEPVSAEINRRPELPGQLFANDAGGAVGGDDQIGRRESAVVERANLLPRLDLHAQ
jgi:hypothetical protein